MNEISSDLNWVNPKHGTQNPDARKLYMEIGKNRVFTPKVFTPCLGMLHVM